ncbi:hypothetical protein LTR53_006547 [Teratosphaeriaceae sp. CCFEE 6253]|nr:hypothetical protein LTR53_006547 [Teratosphaeriaceae sp. CCFEE 6253]
MQLFRKMTSALTSPARAATPTPTPCVLPIIYVTPPSPIFDPSLANFRRDNLTIKLLGAGDNGEAHLALPKRTADTFNSSLDAGAPLDAALRAAQRDLFVVKFAKPDALEGDLENEIWFMTAVMGDLLREHAHLTHALDCCLGDGVQWLALPLCRGGTLQAFLKQFPDAVSPAFIWHVGAQVIGALLYLHHGILDQATDITPAADWPMVFHEDCYPCNLLLQPAQAFGAFPDVVLADFGRAAAVSTRASCDQMQSYDYADAGNVLVELLSLTKDRDPTLRAWSSWLQDTNLMTGAKALPVLQTFMQSAARRRETAHEPLAGAAAEFLAADFDRASLRRVLVAPDYVSVYFAGCRANVFYTSVGCILAGELWPDQSLASW